MEKNTENTKMTNIFESLNHTDTILKNIKSIFLSLGSIIGSFILFSYFSFYVRSIPSNISLGSLSLILLMIAAWAVIVSVFFILISFGSSWWLKDIWSKDEKTRKKQQTYSIGYFIGYPIISGLCLLVINKYTFETMIEKSIFFVIFIIFPLIYALLLSYFENKQSYKIIKPILYTTLIKGMFISLLFYSFINILIALAISSSNLKSLYVLGLLVIIIFINCLILLEKLDDFNIKITFMAMYIISISFYFTALKIDNPIIVLPFQHFRLGNYSEELHFKQSYINETNFLNMKEHNQTRKTFFILSSMGDEYILKNDKNETQPYRINKNNLLLY